MKKSSYNKSSNVSKVFSIIALVAIVISIVGCASPRCGQMKCYNRDVRMGIAR